MTLLELLPVEALMPPALPPCDYCKEEEADHPEWPSDPASVRYDGHWSCGFHAYSFWGTRPTHDFLALGRDV